MPCADQAGTGGGGAIVIASSTSIVLNGAIAAQPTSLSWFPLYGNLSNGSGGAIRLVANSVNISGTLQAYGFSFNSTVSTVDFSPGVVRVEAAPGALTFTGSSTPQAVLSAINPIVGLPATPTLRLVSIGGFPIPAGSGTRADTVDLLLPTQLADPIPLVVEASNIPVGSQVTVLVANNSGSATPGTLTGTDQSSTATLNISGLNRTGASFLFASVIFEVPALAREAACGSRGRCSATRANRNAGAVAVQDSESGREIVRLRRGSIRSLPRCCGSVVRKPAGIVMWKKRL
jgi:hypothetical protein